MVDFAAVMLGVKRCEGCVGEEKRKDASKEKTNILEGRAGVLAGKSGRPRKAPSVSHCPSDNIGSTAITTAHPAGAAAARFRGQDPKLITFLHRQVATVSLGWEVM
jgi:hypothetical protein